MYYGERLNSISHLVGAALALVGLGSLLTVSVQTADPWIISSFTIFGVSLVLLYTMSTLYHSFRPTGLKRLFQLFDHIAIYLLIAGTYTPFMLLAIGGWVGLAGMIIVWSIALVGITCKIFANQRFPKLSVITYLLMGWIAIFFIYPLYNALTTQGLWLLVAGGLCYTVGVLFYVAKKVQFTHAIWHVFVVAYGGV